MDKEKKNKKQSQEAKKLKIFKEYLEDFVLEREKVKNKEKQILLDSIIQSTKGKDILIKNTLS